MPNHQETLLVWNKIARLYQDKFMEMDLYDDTYQAFCGQITAENPTILEIGCGPGNITKHLATAIPNAKILATDMAPNMIILARNNCPTVDFQILDAREIGQIQTKFDGIMAGFCIPYLSQTECAKMISDGNQLLNEGGVFYISFVSGDYQSSGYQTGSSGDRLFFYYHDSDWLTEELKNNGFEKTADFFKKYKKNDNREEVHTIIIAQKLSKK